MLIEAKAHPPQPEGSDHDKAKTHGGIRVTTDEFHFEVAFERHRIHVHAYDRAQDPVDLQGVSGTVRVTYLDGRPEVSATLNYSSGGHGKGHSHDRADYQLVNPEVGHHVGNVSFDRVADGDATIEFELENLPGRFEHRVGFTETFKLARPHEFFCPRGCVVSPHEPGDCPNCSTTFRVRRFVYNCADHPLVTAREPDETCWIDGRELRKVPQGLDKR